MWSGRTRPTLQKVNAADAANVHQFTQFKLKEAGVCVTKLASKCVGCRRAQACKSQTCDNLFGPCTDFFALIHCLAPGNRSAWGITFQHGNRLTSHHRCNVCDMWYQALACYSARVQVTKSVFHRHANARRHTHTNIGHKHKTHKHKHFDTNKSILQAFRSRSKVQAVMHAI